jgi:hypothetical protein
MNLLMELALLDSCLVVSVLECVVLLASGELKREIEGGRWERTGGELDFLRLRCCLGEGGCVVAVNVRRGVVWR